MRSVFVRLDAPAMSAMRARGNRRVSAKNAIKASFAFPSTGGAVSAILTEPA